ncbi:hypothetical protein QQS21_002467 [Conoideocrella luteorostrata]|uniref:Uncharacterized protein n=1 Tax=Conoideocrella luteorostrata TaxID=1105319 RepID=A0AAJ0FWJ3_9HYPO|nr:hypothetical protein QQS21_002467 [Conoideocrella luteorostrata]
MSSSSSSDSPDVNHLIEEKLRSKCLEHFGLCGKDSDRPVKFRFKSYVTTANLKYYSVRTNVPGSLLCHCMVFPPGTCVATAKRYLETAEIAYNAIKDSVPQPLARHTVIEDCQTVPKDHHFILFRSQETQARGSSTNNIISRLKRLHESTGPSDPNNRGLESNPEQQQTWQKWFAVAMSQTLKRMKRIDDVQQKLQDIDVMELTNRLLGAVQQDSARLGLVHENLLFKNVEVKMEGKDEPVFNDAVYFYGPQEWILTTGAEYSDNMDQSADVTFTDPEDQGKARLKLYTAYVFEGADR